MFVRAGAASAGAAAALVLLFGWPWRAPNAVRRALGEVLGAAAAIYLGAWMLGWSFNWPPKSAEDRFFVILLPVVILVETAAAFPKVQWLIWTLRLLIAIGAARLLLHDSVYLKGTDSSGWSAAEATTWLVGLALALRAVWLVLIGGNGSVPHAAVPLILGVTAAGATVMLAVFSAYANGSLLGLPLAGAMIGVSLAGLALARSPGGEGAIGVSIVGLFGLLVIGRFFASLTTLHAGILLLAPAVYWLVAFAWFERFRPWLRGAVAVALTAAVVAGVVLHAKQEFEREQEASSSSPGETDAEDLYK